MEKQERTAAPVVHLLCGLVCAGKTTLAKKLAEELPAVRFTRDEWVIRLYGLRHDDPRYAERLPGCTDFIWAQAAQVLRIGGHVVLDWAHWSREQRADSAQRARALGYHAVVHHLNVPVEVAITRAMQRQTDRPADAHSIDADGVRHFATIFQPPNIDEGLHVISHDV